MHLVCSVQVEAVGLDRIRGLAGCENLWDGLSDKRLQLGAFGQVVYGEAPEQVGDGIAAAIHGCAFELGERRYPG